MQKTVMKLVAGARNSQCSTSLGCGFRRKTGYVPGKVQDIGYFVLSRFAGSLRAHNRAFWPEPRVPARIGHKIGQPAERMKMNRQHVVPLSMGAMTVLRRAEALRRGDTISSFRRALAACSTTTRFPSCSAMRRSMVPRMASAPHSRFGRARTASAMRSANPRWRMAIPIPIVCVPLTGARPSSMTDASLCRGGRIS